MLIPHQKHFFLIWSFFFGRTVPLMPGALQGTKETRGSKKTHQYVWRQSRRLEVDIIIPKSHFMQLTTHPTLTKQKISLMWEHTRDEDHSFIPQFYLRLHLLNRSLNLYALLIYCVYFCKGLWVRLTFLFYSFVKFYASWWPMCFSYNFFCTFCTN